MKLGGEVLAGPSFEEAPTGAFAEEERTLAQAKKMFLLAAGDGGAEIPRATGRAAGNRGVACEYRDGNLRHGIGRCGARRRPRPRAEKRPRVMARRGARVHLRRRGSRGKGSAHGAGRDAGRRHAPHATGGSEAFLEARAGRRYRAAPSRCRRGAGAGSLSVRGALSEIALSRPCLFADPGLVRVGRMPAPRRSG